MTVVYLFIMLVRAIALLMTHFQCQNVFSEYFSLDLNSDGAIEASEIGGSSFGALLLLGITDNTIWLRTIDVNVTDLDADGPLMLVNLAQFQVLTLQMFR